MRPFLLLLVGLLLAGVGQGAFAARYSWQGIDAENRFQTERISCAEVASHEAARYTAIAKWGGQWWWDGTCTGSVRGVGDVFSYQLVMQAADSSYAVSSISSTLSGIIEDDFLDDVASVPLQRVLVMVGCALMFGIGMVVGKA